MLDNPPISIESFSVSEQSRITYPVVLWTVLKSSTCEIAVLILFWISSGSDLIVGDSLEIRASITDRNGNLTHGLDTVSTQKLVYDPEPPVVGQINGGNMFNDTPQYLTIFILMTPYRFNGLNSKM